MAPLAKSPSYRRGVGRGRARLLGAEGVVVVVNRPRRGVGRHGRDEHPRTSLTENTFGALEVAGENRPVGGP